MELISGIPVLGPFVSFVIVLSIVVAIHELGHLMVGRWCGIRAEVFSIGFGKVLWSRRDRHGTVWQVAMLPFGGFVKFLGDMDPASARQADDSELRPEDRAYAFHNAALWKRTLTVAAGPVANFLLSLIIFFGLALQSDKYSDLPVIGSIDADARGIVGFAEGDRILAVNGTETPDFPSAVRLLNEASGAPVEAVVERDGRRITTEVTYATPPLITDLSATGAAIAAGLRPGDIIVEINGSPIASSRELALRATSMSVDGPSAVRIDRDGELLDFEITARLVTRENPETGLVEPVPTLGVMLGEIGMHPPMEPTTLSDAANYAVGAVWRIVSDTVLYIHQMLFKGADTGALSGPIGIAKHSADAAKAGGLALLQFVAFVSTAIGLLNLFPIPVLDGGHLLFYLTEAIRGKPASETIVKFGTMAGLSLLLLLMVFVTFNNDLGLGDWLSQN